MGSLLATMAIVKPNWNEDGGYLSNFEPFVAEVLRTWPSGDSVPPEALRDQLSERFSIPTLPINAAQALRDRAANHGLLQRAARGGYFPRRDALATVDPLGPVEEEVLGPHARASGQVVEFASGPSRPRLVG